MNQKIHIENPCPANWHGMKPDKDGRHCNSCQKIVVDFSGKTLNEIQEYLTEYKGSEICGNYQERHTTVSNRWYDMLNSIERALVKVRLQRVSVILITAMLLLTGCYRHLRGKYAKGSFSAHNGDKVYTASMQPSGKAENR